MARLLVQLKLRLLLDALRSTRAAKVSFIISTISPCCWRVGTSACWPRSAARARRGSDRGRLHHRRLRLADPAAAGLRLDSTLDPATMALYPLRTRPLATGLLAASATGAWPVGQRDRPARGADRAGQRRARRARRPGRGAAAGAVLHRPGPLRDHLSMAGLLRSRRGKDLAAFLFIPIIAGYEFFTQVVPKAGRHGEADHRELHRLRRRGCAGCRRAWPRTRSRMRRTGIPARRCRAWRRSPPSSSCSAGCGSGR